MILSKTTPFLLTYAFAVTPEIGALISIYSMVPSIIVERVSYVLPSSDGGFGSNASVVLAKFSIVFPVLTLIVPIPLIATTAVACVPDDAVCGRDGTLQEVGKVEIAGWQS